MILNRCTSFFVVGLTGFKRCPTFFPFENSSRFLEHTPSSPKSMWNTAPKSSQDTYIVSIHLRIEQRKILHQSETEPKNHHFQQRILDKQNISTFKDISCIFTPSDPPPPRMQSSQMKVYSSSGFFDPKNVILVVM